MFKQIDSISSPSYQKCFAYLEKLGLRKRPPSDPRISLYRMAYDTLARHVGASRQQPLAFIPSLPSRQEEQVMIKTYRTAWNK